MTYEMPILLTGDKLIDALEFTVDGPEVSDRSARWTDPMQRFEHSAKVAISGMRQWLLDLTGLVPPAEVIEVSATYPAVARLTRIGKWQSGSEFDLDMFLRTESLPLPEIRRSFALLLNALDHPRDLHGPVWGPIHTMREIADQQRQQYEVQERGASSGGWAKYFQPSAPAAPPFSISTTTGAPYITVEQARQQLGWNGGM